MRKFSIAIVLVDSDQHPLIADVTSDFLYLRLQRTAEEIDTGYAKSDLATWAKRDVFVYMISGAKVRAPAAAQALLGVLK